MIMYITITTFIYHIIQVHMRGVCATCGYVRDVPQHTTVHQLQRPAGLWRCTFAQMLKEEQEQHCHGEKCQTGQFNQKGESIGHVRTFDYSTEFEVPAECMYVTFGMPPYYVDNNLGILRKSDTLVTHLPAKGIKLSGSENTFDVAAALRFTSGTTETPTMFEQLDHDGNVVSVVPQFQLQQGHYQAYVPAENDQWLKLDDMLTRNNNNISVVNSDFLQNLQDISVLVLKKSNT